MKRIAFCLTLAALALPAFAQQGHQGHGTRALARMNRLLRANSALPMTRCTAT
jgi:hypothetical protein